MFTLMLRDIKTYITCPELRATMRHMYAAKVASIMTVIIFSPLILFGLVSIGLVHIFDLMGQIFLWPTHKITTWLYDFQRNKILEAHSIIPLDNIQERLGDKEHENI